MRRLAVFSRVVTAVVWMLLAAWANVSSTTAAEVRAVVGRFDVVGSGVTMYFELRTDNERYLEGLVVDTRGGVAAVTAAELADDSTVLRFETESASHWSLYDLAQGVAVNPFGLGLQFSLAQVEQTVSPSDARSPVELAITHENATVTLRWSARPGPMYQIGFSPSSGGPWTTVATVAGNLALHQWADPAGATAPHGFYRLSFPVVINGAALSEEQLQALEALYGVRPLPGQYWYDPLSGLYGAAGFAAFSFMYPGHDLGELPRDASLGNTGVLINGRGLPISEYWLWSLLLGAWIPPGPYWLDAEGNAGVVGNPIPLVSLAQGGEQNNYAGEGSGGDNFWSTKFSAGNCVNGCQQGYVSVPGYGPIGYGF